MEKNLPIIYFKEAYCLVKDKDYYSLFLSSTENSFIQFFRYIFVGGSSFILDAGALWILNVMGLHYLVAALFANIVGLIANYTLSKCIIFMKDSKKFGRLGEFTMYGIIGFIGLVLTEIIMFVFTDVIGFYFMISKVISAALIFIWNFLARKVILYM